MNPNGSGVNQPIPADVDRMEIAAWWYEPNLASGETPAEIDIDLIKAAGGLNVIYQGGSMIQSRRFIRGDAGGNTWTIRLVGTNVTASTDANYYSGQQTRKIHIAQIYEEVQRDDSDGPHCCDEIDMTEAQCCAIAGSVCPGTCP